MFVSRFDSKSKFSANLWDFSDSIPGIGGDKSDDAGTSKEEQQEQERLRQEAINQAEKERRLKYKKQDEDREGLRQTIRDKVRKEWFALKSVLRLAYSSMSFRTQSLKS